MISSSAPCMMMFVIRLTLFSCSTASPNNVNMHQTFCGNLHNFLITGATNTYSLYLVGGYTAKFQLGPSSIFLYSAVIALLRRW